ncbi:RNase H family protein [Glaciihabitans sp. dw_435]|uniref:RNase H family protein n=1 Tax=Glaciihabitans sp. dw_435 TaxID=2720081 RepID=UPI001BD4625C|nr:RNase H family protein [Glaciihabitans sp. dw_435]
MTIRAAADGSALGNPGPAGWAWYVDDTCWAAGGWKHATNNQGELMAVLQLFKATAHLDDDLLILCDSQYVINSVTKWMPGWKKKGWRKADGKPVMNVELLREIDEALVGRKYRFEWVKGHANHPLNEAADSRARAVSEAFQRGGPIPTGPGWVRGGDPMPSGDLVGGADDTVELPSTPGERAAAALAAPIVATSTAPAVATPREVPTLFALDELDEQDAIAPEEPIELTVSLTPAQFARLRARASAAGLTPEQALAKLL